MEGDLETNNRNWLSISDEEYYLLEIDTVKAAKKFIEDYHANEDSLIKERLNSPHVLQAGVRLLRRMVAVRFGAAYRVEGDLEGQLKVDYKKTREILKKIQQLRDEVPTSIKSRFSWNHLDKENLDGAAFDVDETLLTESHFFSIEVGALLLDAIEECEKKLKPKRGPQPNLQLKLPVGCCIAALEALTGRKFVRNFDSAKGKVGTENTFVNLDAKFCQEVLQVLDPALRHTQVKSALKMHFARSSAKGANFSDISLD